MKIRSRRLAGAAWNRVVFRGHRFSYEDWLMCCFGIGITGGTAIVLLFGEGAMGSGVFVKEAGETGWEGGIVSYITRVFQSPGISGIIQKEGFVVLLMKRLFQLTAGWIAGLTICSRFFFGCLTCWAGMCLSGTLALLTLEKGVWGLPVFLWLTFPQGAVYGIVWAVLAGWAGKTERRLHLAAFCLLLLFTVAGVLAEAVFHG